MNLVVYQMMKLQVMHVSDSNRAVKVFSRPAVPQTHLAVSGNGHALPELPVIQILDGGPSRQQGCCVPCASCGGYAVPAQRTPPGYRTESSWRDVTSVLSSRRTLTSRPRDCSSFKSTLKDSGIPASGMLSPLDTPTRKRNPLETTDSASRNSKVKNWLM